MTININGQVWELQIVDAGVLQGDDAAQVQRKARLIRVALIPDPDVFAAAIADAVVLACAYPLAVRPIPVLPRDRREPTGE